MKTIKITTLALAAALAACGGQELANDVTPAGDPQARFVTPLVDEEGRPMPVDPDALPADPALRKTALLYATPAQAEQMTFALGERALSLSLADGGPADAALQQLRAQQQAQGLDDDAPVLLRSHPLALAVDTAQRLGAAGFSRVWVVTP